MLELLGRIAIPVAAGVIAGLRLFLQSDLSHTRKVAWTAFLILVGIGIGAVFPLSQVWRKFRLDHATLGSLYRDGSSRWNTLDDLRSPTGGFP